MHLLIIIFTHKYIPCGVYPLQRYPRLLSVYAGRSKYRATIMFALDLGLRDVIIDGSGGIVWRLDKARIANSKFQFIENLLRILI